MGRKPRKSSKSNDNRQSPGKVQVADMHEDFESHSTEDESTYDELAEEDSTSPSMPVPASVYGEWGTDRSDLDRNLESLPANLDPLKRYIEEISRYPLLAPEEEFELAVKLIKTGDLDAAKRLVSANLRLVVKIAMEYRSAYQNVLDLIQEGNIGLMKAVSKFDPSKGAKLSYYASWWIRSYILKYILDNFRLVRVGTTQAQKKLFFHLVREKERLEAQGLDAGPKLLADKLQVREKDVIEMEQRLGIYGTDVSLNNPIGSEEGEARATHLDMVQDGEVSQDDVLAEEELKKILLQHLDDFSKQLTEKERAVFKERMHSENPKTLQEVADMFGLTRERARQIEAKVIEKLKNYYEKYIR